MSDNTERDKLASVIIEYLPGADGPADSRTITDAILAEFMPEHDQRVKAEAAHDALMAEADAIENYTLMWMPGGGVSLDHILGLLRRDAGIRRES